MLTKVEELIDPHTGQWDEVLIRDVFWPVDVHRILQIPLRVHVMDDFVSWHYNRTGSFTVRSAYHTEFKHQFGRQVDQSSPQGSREQDIWKHVWALRVPGKVKHFVWKVIRGVLPCFGTLAGRHIPVTGQCPVCRVGYEDTQHCLFQCARALEIWEKLGLKDEIQKSVLQDRLGSFTMSTLMYKHEITEGLPMAELMAVASWYIWWQRRQLVKEKWIPSPDRTAVSILVLATNFFR